MLNLILINFEIGKNYSLNLEICLIASVFVHGIMNVTKDKNIIQIRKKHFTGINFSYAHCLNTSHFMIGFHH